MRDYSWPGQPPRAAVSPGQTSRSVAGGDQPLLDPEPLSERQNASWIFLNRSWTPSTLPPLVLPFLPFPKIPSALPPLFH